MNDYTFSVFPNLEALELSGCSSLSKIQPRAFYGPSLTSLDISNNNLNTPSHYWFDSFDCDVSATSVDLAGNPWLCDCDAYEYENWMRNSCFEWQEKTTSQIECKQPIELEGFTKLRVLVYKMIVIRSKMDKYVLIVCIFYYSY